MVGPMPKALHIVTAGLLWCMVTTAQAFDCRLLMAKLVGAQSSERPQWMNDLAQVFGALPRGVTAERLSVDSRDEQLLARQNTPNTALHAVYL